jgi:transposase-like protein
MYYGAVRKYGTGLPMRGDLKKTPVVAIVERHGKVVAKAIPDVSGATLLGAIRRHVLPGSVIYTDELPSYDGISTMRTKEGKPARYVHYRIRHKDRVYVRGHIHTNSVEGFWSLVKRGIGGVYHSVGQKYLQNYLDEYTFRFNRRHMGNQQFRSILARVSEKAS